MPGASADSKRWPAPAGDVPDSPEAALQAISLLRQAADFAAAEAGLRQLVARYPGHRKIAVQHARSASQLGDWPEAARRWSELHARFPVDRVITLGLAEAWMRHGELDAAEQMLAAALPAELVVVDRQVRSLMIAHAELATRRGDLSAARDRWRALLKHFPDDAKIQVGLAAVSGASDGLDAESDHRRQTMLQFESLGSSCEFGLVQRHFGAEPLGLFRWVSLRAPHLIAALRTDLAGIGAPEYTQMFSNDRGQFLTSDSRYRLQMHTFIKDNGQNRDVLFAQLRERMVFLKRKLLEDLAAGDKIFVYRAEYRITPERILAIAEELKRYNAGNRLAAVIAPVPGQPQFDNGFLAAGVLCTVIPSGRIMPLRRGWKIDFPAWLEFCQSALEAFV